MYPFPLHIWFEIGALVIALCCWPWIRKSPLRWFLFFLLAIVAVEMTGRYYRRILHEPNTWLYNISIPGEFLFFGFIFFLVFKTPGFRKFALGFLVGYPVIVAINLFISGTYYLNSLNVVIGAFFIIIFCCLFFYEILKDEEMTTVLDQPLFWIVSGLFLFCTGEFFYNLFFSLIKVQGLSHLRKYSKAINNNLILVLYTCISIGLIWEAVKKKYSSRSSLERSPS